MKTFFITLAIIIAGLASFQLYQSSNEDDALNEWGQQTLELFQGTAEFFSSLSSNPKATDELDEELKALLPNEKVELRFEPQLEETLNVANGEPTDISPEALLPNLFQNKEKSGTSVKGEIFTDKEDKIIGGKVQVAIPTDM
ncbi:MAG: hypothetical protein HWE18_10965 [Gammaproteobacteria bacterium]|nr:hypothetical protein [Gammaproteobacteria bacterium]